MSAFNEGETNTRPQGKAYSLRVIESSERVAQKINTGDICVQRGGNKPEAEGKSLLQDPYFFATYILARGARTVL